MSVAAATAAPKRPIEHYELDWRGIQVRVTYEPDAFGAAGDLHHYSHLQVSNARHRQPLPMSETGYKSHHLPQGEVEAGGGPVAYVSRWLETASRKPAWKAMEQERRQGCLF
jgi:hypothetical protein